MFVWSSRSFLRRRFVAHGLSRFLDGCAILHSFLLQGHQYLDVMVGKRMNGLSQKNRKMICSCNRLNNKYLILAITKSAPNTTAKHQKPCSEPTSFLGFTSNKKHSNKPIGSPLWHLLLKSKS